MAIILNKEKAIEMECGNNYLDVRVKRLGGAHEAVKNYTIIAAGLGFIPVPLVDISALTAIKLKLLHRLARDYGVPFYKNLASSLISTLLSSSVAISMVLPLASLLKSIPVVGQTAGVISTAIIGAASTYAVGKLFVGHFESGGTFLTFDAKKSRNHFEELYEEGKAFVSSQ
ncbi:MAG: DUF697 domain-containing protein [Methylococcales bacterium]|nr:DUF697 domain-containing protein [Methylococcales bacterium]